VERLDTERTSSEITWLNEVKQNYKPRLDQMKSRTSPDKDKIRSK